MVSEIREAMGINFQSIGSEAGANDRKVGFKLNARRGQATLPNPETTDSVMHISLEGFQYSLQILM